MCLDTQHTIEGCYDDDDDERMFISVSLCRTKQERL